MLACPAVGIGTALWGGVLSTATIIPTTTSTTANGGKPSPRAHNPGAFCFHLP